MKRYITTRKRCLRKLNTLHSNLETISKKSEKSLVKFIGTRYMEVISQMHKNTNYFSEIAFIPPIKDGPLGEISVRRIEKFVRDYSNNKK